MGRLGDLSPAASVAVGILVGLLSTSIQSIGLTLQRKSHLLEDSKEDELSRRPPYRRRKWQLGMLMFVVANIVGSTIQITTLPLPVLSTLQASGLVFNTICAALILNEPFTRFSFGGTVLVAAGAVLIALFGALPEPTHNLNQLLGLLGRPQFIVWMFGTFFIIALVLLSALFLPRLTRFKQQLHFEYQPIHHHSTNISPRVRLVTGMSYGFVSAILSAHCLLLAKSAVELILTSLPFTDTSVPHPPTNQFTHYQSYLILLALVTFALAQLYFLHRGLKLASTSVLYPFVFCVYNVIAILDGLIYFNQTDRLPALHAGLIALGTVILLAGVLALSWRLEEQGLQQERELGLETPVTPTAQVSALAPGMGIIEDTPTESPSATETGSTHKFPSDDEESAVPRPPLMSESTPLLPRRSSTRATMRHSVAWDATADDNRRPATGYGSTAHRARRSSISLLTTQTPKRTRFTLPAWDRDEVWSALMDDKEGMVSPIHERGAARHNRRRTITSLPGGGRDTGSEDNVEDEDREVDTGSRPNGKNRETLTRSRTAPLGSTSGSGEESTGEAWKKRRRRAVQPSRLKGVVGGEGRSASSPLLGRADTGGSQRGQRRRGVAEWVRGLMVKNQ